MADGVAGLSLLWWVTGDEKYAKVAGALARAWFLNEKTRMNPNMNYAQVCVVVLRSFWPKDLREKEKFLFREFVVSLIKLLLFSFFFSFFFGGGGCCPFCSVVRTSDQKTPAHSVACHFALRVYNLYP
jgi:hypothetical protein